MYYKLNFNDKKIRQAWRTTYGTPLSIFTQPSARAEFNRFEFRVFLLLDYLPHQG